MVNYCGCGCGLLSLIVCPSQRHNTCLSQPQPPSTPTKPSMPRGLTTLGVVSSCSCGTMRDLQGQSLGETIEEENHFTTTIQGQQGYCPLLIFSQPSITTTTRISHKTSLDEIFTFYVLLSQQICERLLTSLESRVYPINTFANYELLQTTYINTC
jgi:hypothetical protein